MKDQMTAFELKYMVDELQQLVGGRLQQIYQPKGLLLQIHKTGVGKSYLRIESNALWLVEEKQEMPVKQSGLCQAMRKYVKGKKIESIQQIGSERIVEIVLKTEKETYYLYVELFSKGNIILCDENKKIIKALEERAWKDREIISGVNYELPPLKENIFSLEDTDLKDDEKYLATIGFGKLYAKEILARGDAVSGYKSLMSEKTNPHVYCGEATPVQMKSLKEGINEETFSKAIQKIWKDEKPKKKETRLDKVRKKIEMQEKLSRELATKAEEEQRKGELIYENYELVKKELDTAKGPNKIIIDL